MTALQVTWFLLVGVLLTGYAILDGFDLGVGFWHLFTKTDHERRVLLNAIGPVWDGNEVWLLTGGGALFAAFPPVYATVFSSLYLALMLLLAGLIFRAVAIEFRSKVETQSWRKTWDTAFSFGSIVPGLLFGVALGNLLRGIPIDAQGNYAGTFFGLLNPFSLLVGVAGLAMFAAHGALYIAVKSEEDLHDRAITWAKKASIVNILFFAVVTVWSFAAHRHLLENFRSAPILFLIPVLAFGMMLLIPFALRAGAPFLAFLASSASILGVMGTVGASMFPNFVYALGNPANSLTIYNSSSSEKTLSTMLVLALIGVPLVLAYTVYAYRTFRGKVKLDEHSY